MSDDKDKTPPEAPGAPATPEGEEERTVFMPQGFTLPPAGAEPAPLPPEPVPEAPAEPVAETPAEPAAPPPMPEVPAPEAPAAATGGSGGSQAAFAPRADAVSIKVGDVLNHIFKVNRFLARGGMGEVFEGCNINTDEKVAIKVMLPSLASDEKIIAMFRKEARTLTKLHHQALVQYRVLAQEPQLHVLYIVTDFIEGTNLSTSLGTLKPTPDELAGLLRRLASGLAVAHELGAVHRDISPDNVILEDDDIDDAKIIDFGIAKDLDASSATIVGDGFAGKLNYVAPEQLGDFGREVGPWTDVYSLALVILAVAQGRNVDLSGSLVDAIDKRRKGPDISAIPDNLKPLIQAMLRPDPKERLRSMEDVLQMLDGARIPSPRTVRADVVEAAAIAAADDELSTPAASGNSRPLLIILAVLAGVAALLAVLWYFTGGTFGIGGRSGATNTIGGNNAILPQPAPPANLPPAELARATINSTLPQVPCAWLDVGDVRDGDPLGVTMRGVAGDTGAAQRELGRALGNAGLANVNLDFADVAPITQAGCAALDTYNQVRNTAGPRRISVSQPRYEMTIQSEGRNVGALASNAVVDLDLGGGAPDFALVGIEPSGAITPIVVNRQVFLGALARSRNGRPVRDLGGGHYRLNIDVTHTGWSGLMLVTGRGPFDAGLLGPRIGARGPDWQQQFLGMASSLGWRTEMVWFDSVNRVPDAPAYNPGGSGPPPDDSGPPPDDDDGSGPPPDDEDGGK